MQPPVYIICFGCEAAVRELSCNPCPVCSRCAFCGQRLGKQMPRCDCKYDEDEEKVTEISSKYGIPEDRLPGVRRRFEIRNQLQRSKIWISSILSAVSVTGFGLYRGLAGPAWLADSLIFAVVSVTIGIIVAALVNRCFRWIENSYLNREDLGVITTSSDLSVHRSPSRRDGEVI